MIERCIIILCSWAQTNVLEESMDSIQSISVAVMSKQILDLLLLEIIFNLSTRCLLYAQAPYTLPAIGTTSTQLMVWICMLDIFYYPLFASFLCFRNRYIFIPDVRAD